MLTYFSLCGYIQLMGYLPFAGMLIGSHAAVLCLPIPGRRKNISSPAVAMQDQQGSLEDKVSVSVQH